MLQFIFGRSGFGKTYMARNLIFESAKNGKDKLMVIVPEQNSFETETAILDMMGPILAQKIDVVSFTRLLDLVSRKYGGRTSKRINKGDRTLLMSLAIDEVKDKLNIYKGQAEKAEFIEVMISALTEFKMCNIDFKELIEKSENVREGTLREKLVETSLILNAYESLISNTYIDPLDDLTRLHKMLLDSNFFEGYTVAIDGFDGFTMQQYRIIEDILRQAESVYITFCTNRDVFKSDEFDLFFPVNRSAKKILRLAKEAGVEICDPIYLDMNYRTKSEDLLKLEENVFRIEKKSFENKTNNVVIYNANTKYDEVDFVSRTIKHLIMEQGYKYGDIAILTRNEQLYKGIIDYSLEKYDIPYFMDKREDIDSKPLMHVLLGVFEVINSGFSTQSIFRYLKTLLIGFTTEEISILENYVLFWNIDRKKWLHEFTSNPSGYFELNDDDIIKLEEINKIRDRVIKPILKLYTATKNTDGKSITMALYKFLEDIDVVENLKSYVKNLISMDEDMLAKEQARLFDIMVEILDRLSIILDGKAINTKKYAQLLKLVINSNDIAFIPKGIDDVTFGSIDRVRVEGAKVVFLLGAVEGEFPRMPVPTGLFSDTERRELIEIGLSLYDSVEGLYINERFLAYKCMAIPSNKLYISWPCASGKNGIKRESEIIKETRYILPMLCEMDEYSQSIDNEVFTKKQCFELCARHFRDNSRFSHTLKKYFKDDKEYEKQFNAIEKILQKRLFRFYDEEKAKLLFGEDINVSASQIEKYYLCKFSYFCKYGMLAKIRKKASFDALEYGNTIHFLLEKLLKKHSKEALSTLNKEDVEREIKEGLELYMEKRLGGFKEKTERINYLLARLVKILIPLINHLVDELSQSEFSPTDFELDLSHSNKVNPLKIKLPDGSFVNVDGKIDRVDVMNHNGTNYVRIIDYKTGIKDFKLSDILYGLNMQMLIYLEAIVKGGKGKYKGVRPAGILYMPSKTPIINADRGCNLEKITKERNRKLRMNGLILDSNDIIYGMDKKADGEFIPVTIKDGASKSKDSLADATKINSIFKYIDKLIVDMAMELKSGKIEAIPTKGEYDACEYCEYTSICGAKDKDALREVKKLNYDEAFNKILEGMEEINVEQTVD